MIHDLDIYRSAQILIREHGEDTAVEAAQRADAVLEKGDRGYAMRRACRSVLEHVLPF